MKLPNPYRCDGDGCEQVKGPTNRWWLLDSTGDGDNSLTLYPWDDEIANGRGVRHLCAPKHAYRKRYLNGWHKP